jgi:hypothetical protein
LLSSWPRIRAAEKPPHKNWRLWPRAPEQVAATMIDNQLIQSALPDVLVSPAADKIKAHSREKGDIERTIYQDTYRLCQQVADDSESEIDQLMRGPDTSVLSSRWGAR